MQCIKLPSNVVGNLKITCDASTSTVVYWSKYQLFIQDVTHLIKKIEPQFDIEDVVILNGYLVCLDCSHNVNISTINNSDECFIIWKQKIKCVSACDSKYLVCMEFEQNNGTRVLVTECFNTLSSINFSSQSREIEVPIPYDWMQQDDNEKTCILVCAHIDSKYSSQMKNIFNIQDVDSEHLLVVISLDKKNVYYYILNLTENSLNVAQNSPDNWVKLYKSYTNIVDIKIDVSNVNDTYVLIGLAGGNIVKISLSHKNQNPEVYHLNTAINKFVMIGNAIVYNDGLTMWKNENVFSNTDFMFKQFVVRNIRDFCIVSNQVICITYSNLIYFIDVNQRSSYVPSKETESCPVELVTNSDYLQKIMQMVQSNEKLLKKINKESEYLMALSLSKRHDVMDDLIQVSATVFDNFKDIASKKTDLSLTDDLQAYYDPESYYFLINIIVNRVQHKLNRLLSDVLGDIKIHITLSSHGLLKTTSIQLKEQLTKKNFVIPLKRQNRNIKRMQVHIQIVTNIPEEFDENQSLYSILYKKCIDLKAENFINTKISTNATLLKEREESLDMLIYKRVKHVHNAEYKFEVLDDQRYKWTLYIKLPSNSNFHIEDILGLINTLESKRACSSLLQLMGSSKGKKCLEFQIGKEPVRLNIAGANLEVTCPDITVASDIRNLFSSAIFNTFKDNFSNELIDFKYYSIIEGHKRNIITYINRSISAEDFAILFTRFLRTLYCVLPL